MEEDIKFVQSLFEGCPLIPVISGDGESRKFILNSVTEQEPDGTSPETLQAVARSLMSLTSQDNLSRATKLVGEEDKGGIYVAACSILSGKSFGMARWTNSGVSWKNYEVFNFEYGTQRMYLFGVKRGDRVIIVDDIVSTGGTLAALVKSLKRENVDVLDIVCIADKVEYGGIERVKRETGCDVKVLFHLSVSGEKCHVVDLSI